MVIFSSPTVMRIQLAKERVLLNPFMINSICLFITRAAVLITVLVNIIADLYTYFSPTRSPKVQMSRHKRKNATLRFHKKSQK